MIRQFVLPAMLLSLTAAMALAGEPDGAAGAGASLGHLLGERQAGTGAAYAAASPAVPAGPHTNAGLIWLPAVGRQLAEAGPALWLLLVVLALGGLRVLERVIALGYGRHLPPGLMDEVLELTRKGGRRAVLDHLAEEEGALAWTVRGIFSSGETTSAGLRQALDGETARLAEHFRYRLRPVGLVITVAPVLGLLATVTSLIALCYQAAAAGAGSLPALLAGGIGKALVPTAIGLAVAAAFQLTHHLLRGRGERIVWTVDQVCLDFLSGRLGAEARARRRAEMLRMSRSQVMGPHIPDDDGSEQSAA